MSSRIDSGAGAEWLWSIFLLAFLLARTAAQPHFLSIDCGGSQESRSSPEGIEWKTDNFSAYSNHSFGLAASVRSGNASLPAEMHTLRYFAAPVSPRRSCYAIPLETAGGTYLFRAGFLYGNYDELNSPPSFLVSLNYDYWGYVQLKSGDEVSYLETISSMPGNTLTFCLIRAEESVAALVNSLELRLITAGRYVDSFANSFTNSYLNLVTRVNFGGPFLRYPQDIFDRKWLDYLTVFPDLSNFSVIQTSEPVNVSYDPSGLLTGGVDRTEPPLLLMQTAITSQTRIFFSFNPVVQPLSGSSVYKKPTTVDVFAHLYFSFYNKTAEAQAAFGFDCTNLFDEPEPSLPKVPPAYSTTEYSMTATVNTSINLTYCEVYKTSPNILDPVINAIEFYTSQGKTLTGTSALDVQALGEIADNFNLQDIWFGDPCLPIPWNELNCSAGDASLIRITSLDLSGMKLTGPIPASIASLTSLIYLNLSNNKLQDDFPSWLGSLSNLKILDVSNNELTGSFPESLTSLGKNFSYSGNPKLCISTDQQCSRNNKLRIIISVVLGGVVLLTMAVAPLIYITFVSNSSTNGILDRDYRRLQTRLREKGASAQPFSYAKVRKATNNFRNKVGEGGFGPVYRGVLKDGQAVAVKVLSGTSHQGKQEFYNEIELLSVVHHKYLVSLLGFCQSWNNQILIYEFMVGGDLNKRLRGNGGKAVEDPLSWKQRTTIISEVAEGLDYLHNGCSPGIIHRDVKSNNILLDDRKCAKVADFGLSKLRESDDEATHITTAVKGTTGYLDPEYYISHKLTEKSDVYGFGVLLMEILTGRAPVDHKAPPNELFIVDWVRRACKSERVRELVDPNLKGYYDEKEFSGLVNLSLWCVEHNGKNRPTMTGVVQELRVMGLETSSAVQKALQDECKGDLLDEEADMRLDLRANSDVQMSGPPVRSSSS